jgi:pyrroline-5-carboxylate reductase
MATSPPIQTDNFKLGFVGAGKMAESIARGVVTSGVLPASRISTAHLAPQRRKAFQSFGVTLFDHNQQVVEDSDVVVFSVKPQIVKDVVLQLKPILANKLLVSVVAGTKLQDLQEWAGNSRFVRVMPNTPAAVGQAASGINSYLIYPLSLGAITVNEKAQPRRALGRPAPRCA